MVGSYGFDLAETGDLSGLRVGLARPRFLGFSGEHYGKGFFVAATGRYDRLYLRRRHPDGAATMGVRHLQYGRKHSVQPVRAADRARQGRGGVRWPGYDPGQAEG